MTDATQFGRYEVEEEVARGGMGVIYRVRDPQMRRFLAMKVLRSEVDEDDPSSASMHTNMSARFTEEAQLTGQLDHPGIIPVYDMGEDEGGRLFFTMRLVKGRTLGEIFGLARSGQEGWTVTRALGVLQKVCEAMAFAHDRGVVHRDLKPANVMVGRFGETYVMDWGLARLIDEEAEPKSKPVEESTYRTVLTSARKDESSGASAVETLDGDVMGTPAYMAPEQARGELQRVGPRSDVYSLGAMLYHLLTGQPPYRKTGETVSAAEVLERLRTGPPTPVAELAEDATPELCAICERAMARELDQRYAGMLEVAEDLQAYVENRVVQAYRGGALVEFRKWVQRNRAVAASLAAVFVVVVVGLAAVGYVQTKARTEVEDKNRELAATNLELEAERKRTAEARDRAEGLRERAEQSEQVALANEKEALWQSYVGNIGAAYASLEVGSASEARRRLAACPEELRNWEWRYLDQRADGSLAVLTGSETFVMTLAVSPVSSKVAAAGGMRGDSGAPDYVVRIWDFESGQLELELEGHETTVASLAYSPGGDTLASADERGNLRLWDVESGELIASASRLGSRIAYHPDGRWIASANEREGRVFLWDSYDLAVVGSRELPWGSNALRFSPDGRTLALAGRDQVVRILDLELAMVRELDASGEVPRKHDPPQLIPAVGVGALDFSPDGRQLVTGSDDGFVRIWDVESGTRQSLLTGHQTKVLAVAWHPRFPWIVSSDETGSVRVWDVETGWPLDVLRGHDEDVHALGFTSLGDRLLSASRDQTVRVWDGQAGANDTILKGYAFPNFRPYRISFSPDGERIVWRRGRNAYVVTDVRTGEDLSSRWTYDQFTMRTVSFAEDGIWDASTSGRLARWDAETGEQTAHLDVWPLASCTFLSDGRTAVVGGYPEPGVVSVPAVGSVDLSTGSYGWKTSLLCHPGRITSSPDGRACLIQGLAVQGGDHGLLHVDAGSGEITWQVWGFPGLHGMAFFPDGERLAHTTYNGWDNTLFIRDARTGELLDSFTGHAQPAVLDISPDGSRVVTANWDGTISLWSPERGEILALPAHSGYAANVRFSPDGQTIASLGQDGRRRLWSATSVDTRQAERRAASRRRRWSVDARQRVDELLKTRVHPAAVVEALEADSTLRPEQRAAAILRARSEGSLIEGIIARSLEIGLDPGRTGAEYMAALEGTRFALERVPRTSKDFPRDALTNIAVTYVVAAAAQYRLGLLREALANLELAEETFALSSSGVLPSIELLRAMAYHRLGEAEAAADAFELGVANARGSDWELNRTLERQARELLEGD